MADYSPPRPRGEKTPPLRYSGEQQDRQRQHVSSQQYTSPYNQQHYGGGRGGMQSDYTNTEGYRPDSYQGPYGQPYKGNYTTPNQYKGPGQYSEHPGGPGQYSEHPRGPGQFPSQPKGPGRYSEQLRGPGQYSEQPRGPGQFSSQPRGPEQFSEHSRGPGQYSEQLNSSGQYSSGQFRGSGQYRQPSGQYSNQPGGPGQYSNQPSGPGQYSNQPSGPGQYSNQPSGPGQYSNQPSGPGQYSNQPSGPGQYSNQASGPGQYSNQPSGLGQYSNQPSGSGQRSEPPKSPVQFIDHTRGPLGGGGGQYDDTSTTDRYYSDTYPRMYTGPVLPSSQRKISDGTRRSQSVREPQRAPDEQLKFRERSQTQHESTIRSGNNFQNTYREQTSPFGSQNNLQAQYGQNNLQSQHGGSQNNLQAQYGNQYGSQNYLQSQFVGVADDKRGGQSFNDPLGVTPKKELFQEPSFVVKTPQTPDEYNYQTPVTPVKSNSGNLSSSSESKSSPVTSTPPQVTTPTSEKDELVAEIERQKEFKKRLIQEVASLEGQKKMIQEEVSVLKEEEKQLSEGVTKLQNEELVLRTRLNQAMQNLELVDKVESQERQKKDGHQQNGVSYNQRESEERIRELEMNLRDRENDIKKKEMELEMQADMLYERNKELELKEYDMKNDMGAAKPTYSTIKERQIQEKQLELDKREEVVNSKEQSLYRRESEFQVFERDRKHFLEQWQKDLQAENERAMENLKKASDMFDAATRVQEQVLGAAEAAELEEKQRIERLNSSSSQGGGGGREGEGVDNVPSPVVKPLEGGGGGREETGGARGPLTKSMTISPPPTVAPVGGYLTQKSHSVDDREVAYMLQMNFNKEALEEDEKFVESLLKDEKSRPAAPRQLSEEEEKRERKIAFGLSPDATDEELEEAIKKLQS